VVCLLSALRFHDLTTQEPHEIWLALPLRAHEPTVDYPLLQTVRMNQRTHHAGIETHLVENVPVRVFSVSKTIADCFKYRSTVGLDVALEALREGWRERRFTMPELEQFARLCRVANVMRPYIEATVAS
jgi:predicted transcriptional regulator of viral defense system